MAKVLGLQHHLTVVGLHLCSILARRKKIRTTLFLDSTSCDDALSTLRRQEERLLIWPLCLSAVIEWIPSPPL